MPPKFLPSVPWKLGLATLVAYSGASWQPKPNSIFPGVIPSRIQNGGSNPTEHAPCQVSPEIGPGDGSVLLSLIMFYAGHRWCEVNLPYVDVQLEEEEPGGKGGHKEEGELEGGNGVGARKGQIKTSPTEEAVSSAAVPGGLMARIRPPARQSYPNAPPYARHADMQRSSCSS